MSNRTRFDIQREIMRGETFTYMGKTRDGAEMLQMGMCTNPTENCIECGRWKKDCDGREEFEPDLDCPSR